MPFSRRWLVTRKHLAGIGLPVLVGSTPCWWTIHQTDRRMRGDFLQQAKLVAQGINTDAIYSLSGSEADLENPAYLQLKKQFSAVRVANPQCRFVYLMGRHSDGQVFMYVDSEPPGSADESLPGEIYQEISIEYQQAFATGSELVEGPISDRWGTRVSALIPVWDHRTGALAAMLGMDVNAANWVRDVVIRSALPLGLVAADPIVRDSLAGRHAEWLLAEWKAPFDEMREKSGVTSFSFLDSSRHCLLRLHDPSRFGDWRWICQGN